MCPGPLEPVRDAQALDGGPFLLIEDRHVSLCRLKIGVAGEALDDVERNARAEKEGNVRMPKCVREEGNARGARDHAEDASQLSIRKRAVILTQE